MAQKYFSNLPKIYYNGMVARNLVLKAQFIKETFSGYETFYPFIIKGDMSPAQIANEYYGSVDYEWVVWFSIEAIDPYYTFPLTIPQFTDYLENKYGDIPTAQTKILFYVYNPSTEANDPLAMYRQDHRLDPQTFAFLSDDEKGFWSPVTAEQYEITLNDSKRVIRLLNNDYLPQLNREIGGIFNG